jgi:hypothetical protein
MKSRLRILGSHKGKLELVLSVTRSPNEDAKGLHGIPGTISGTIGQFDQTDDPLSPLESSMRP